jgi:hypothetical protein
MPRPLPPVDLTKIDFPTDSLTIKDLRKHAPHCFDLPAPDGHRSDVYDLAEPYERLGLEDGFGAIISAERELAILAVRTAQGIAPPTGIDSREAIIETLTSDYISLGLASGKHHAEQLIRSFEQAAAEQAKAYAPRSRS